MTTTQQQQVIDKLVPGAQRAAREHPGTYASVCIAQAILESGWGKSSLSTKWNSWHGIKWMGSPDGPFPQHVTGAVQLETTERPDSGTYVTRAYFRTYADPVGSCLDWAANLKATSAYAKAGAWEATSAEGFIRAIGKPYTGGDSSYAETIISIMRQHNLAKYDTKEPPVAQRTIRGFNVSEDAYWSFLALEELARLKGWCKQTLDIYQGTGYSSKSGGTHAHPGGAIDFWQSSNPTELLKAARNGGFPGWHRNPKQGFAHHVHAGTNLPGRPYSYQIDALKDGYNGLGYLGKGGRDDGPRDGVTFRNWADGLEWLRAEVEKAKPQPARAAQVLADYWNAWAAVDAWDNANPDDATLTGLSDADLHKRFVEHGFTFYDKGDLHENMRFTLADLATGWAMENIDHKPDEVAWSLLQYITAAPPTDITWVELRPVFDAAHAGGAFGEWGEHRTRHSVRAVQEGLVQTGAKVSVDGIYGPETRRAVTDFQVTLRGAPAGTDAADGVAGVHDFLHLTRLCSERIGRKHRARFLY